MEKTITVSALAILLCFGMATYGVFGLANSNKLRNVGQIKTVKITAYWDTNMVNQVTVIDWGMMEQGESKSISLFIVSKSNVEISLNMTITSESWIPTHAGDWITVTWNAEGVLVGPKGSTWVTITVHISENIADASPAIENFEFESILVGTEV